MNIPLLPDLIVVLAVSAAVVLICLRLKIPSVVGFLVSGLLAGPHGLGLVTSSHGIEILAEIGVALLLFTIGLEFSFRSLWDIRRTVFLGGALQVGLTAGLVFLTALELGLSGPKFLFFGLGLALSSTAIVLKLIQERAEIASVHGRTSLGLLIFQDLMVVPMLLVVPLLGGGGGPGPSGLEAVVRGALVILVLAAAARWVIPWVFHQIAGSRSQELFIIATVLVCFLVAWLTAWAGLSLALGAFIAGLIISESPYGHQASANVIPLRDIFASLFFVSIGMLLDLRFLASRPGLVLILALAVVALKVVTAGLAALGLGLTLGTAVLAGFYLGQVGEFSFVLSLVSLKQGIIGQAEYQLFLAVSVLTMVATPWVMSLGRRLSPRLPMFSLGFLAGPRAAEAPVAALENHLVIVGFGFAGRNVARAARLASIPYAVVEMNPATVRAEKAKGEAIVFGDASYPAVLERVRLGQARIMVVTIPDPVAMRRIVAATKNLNPRVHVIVRTRFLQDMDDLYRLGADEVIPEEYETSVEIFARVLRRFFVPQGEIDRFVADLRSEGYEMLRQVDPESTTCDVECLFQDLDLVTLRVHPGSPAEGKSLAELRLRQDHGLTLVLIRRGGKVIAEPGADTVLQEDDVVLLLGRPDRLAQGVPLFRGRE